MKSICATLAMFAVAGASFAQTASPPGSVLSASGGRYVFGQISSFRRDQFLLDTQTGRLWIVSCQKENDDETCAFAALEQFPFPLPDGKYSPTPSTSLPTK